MHEILRFFVESSGTVPSPPASDTSLKAALISAIAVVLAAAITGFAATFTRRHGDHSDEEYVDELVRRAQVAEQRVNVLEARNDSLCDRVDELERYCWRAGIDPSTGAPVVAARGSSKGGDGHGTGASQANNQ